MSENKELVVFDLETTDKDVNTAQIVQFAAIKYKNIFEEEDNARLIHLVNPVCPIAEEATKVHGFTNEHVKDCPRFFEVADEIVEFIGDCDLGGHNVIAFDLPVFLAELRRHTDLKFSIEGRRLIDSLQIFRHVMPHTLEAALNFFTGKTLVGAHDAEADSEATGTVISAELKEYDLSLDQAHDISMGDRLTLDGKILASEEGPVLSFGKFAGETLGRVARINPGFLRWILKKDFSDETKKFAYRALQGEFSKS